MQTAKLHFLPLPVLVLPLHTLFNFVNEYYFGEWDLGHKKWGKVKSETLNLQLGLAVNEQFRDIHSAIWTFEYEDTIQNLST